MPQLQYHIEKSVLIIELKGDFRAFDEPGKVRSLVAAIAQPGVKEVKAESAGLGKWDSSLVVVLYEAAKAARQRQIKFDNSGLPKNLRTLLGLAFADERQPSPQRQMNLPFLDTVGEWGLQVWKAVKKGTGFIHQTAHSLTRMITGQAVMRKVDFMFALEDCSYKAVGIVSLVSFMVGLILAFVGAIQLKNFGAQIYVASLVAIGMIRIMGAIMVGIVMAGRTGAAYAATIGTMQVNEEIDALKTMGIPTTDFLVLPRILALTITMPMLTILADAMGILGGMTVGVVMLKIPAAEYWRYTFNALGMDNFLVGLFHGLVFGVIISICGCYYGIYCGRNADSVGKATTQAVVSAVVWMIVATGMITWIFEVLGI